MPWFLIITLPFLSFHSSPLREGTFPQGYQSLHLASSLPLPYHPDGYVSSLCVQQVDGAFHIVSALSLLPGQFSGRWSFCLSCEGWTASGSGGFSIWSWTKFVTKSTCAQGQGRRRLKTKAASISLGTRRGTAQILFCDHPCPQHSITYHSHAKKRRRKRPLVCETRRL